jgi:hypothetical protein
MLIKKFTLEFMNCVGLGNVKTRNVIVIEKKAEQTLQKLKLQDRFLQVQYWIKR